MNRTQADLEAADEAAKDSFGIDTDPQHRTDGREFMDRERQPAHQPENREPAAKDHAVAGLPEVAWADSGSTQETAVNYQGPATEKGDDTTSAQPAAPGTSSATDHEVQGKSSSSAKASKK